jgi:MFS family permease
MIVTMFPEPADRAKAIGVYAFVASAGGAVGLLAGGVLVQALNWHWIFFVNLPIGVVTAVLTMRLLPDDRGLGLRHGADLLGALLLVSSLMLVVYAIVETTTYGWGSLHTIVFGGIAVTLMIGFIVRQATAAQPLMELRVLRSRDVAGANVIQMLMVAGIFGLFFLGALYLQQVLHYDALQVGLAFLPVALGIAVMSLGFSARLIERFGPRLTLVPGLALVGVGLLVFQGASDHASYFPDLLPALLPLGIGAGLAFPALMTLAMSTATPEDSGLISGLVNTSQQVGGALGLSILASLSASHSSSLLQAGRPAAAALTGGYHLAFEIAAIAVGVALVLSIALVRSPREGDADVVPLDEEAGERSEQPVLVNAG